LACTLGRKGHLDGYLVGGQELRTNEEALENIEPIIQESKEVKKPSISIIEVKIVTEVILISLPSFEFLQHYFGKF